MISFIQKDCLVAAGVVVINKDLIVVVYLTYRSNINFAKVKLRIEENKTSNWHPTDDFMIKNILL